jgi:tripartite-type tricarboxylate transporter receptor subunit TctC
MNRAWSALIASFALSVATGYAQTYPVRPIRVLVPFAPGGGSDIVARAMEPRLSQELGRQIVIDNRPGASGNIGVEMAARSTPDGYTVLLANSGAMAINPAMFPKFPIRPEKDFVPITRLVDVTGALVIHPSVPVSTLKDFIAHAKSQPGRLNYGSSGAGAPFRLAMEYFMREAGIRIVHVPYKSVAPATIGLLGGEVQAVFTGLASVMPHVNVGKLKLLAIVAPSRLAVLPATPTMAESGFPRMTASSWQAIYVPAGTPRPIVNRLFEAAQKVITDPDVARMLHEGGIEVSVSKSPEEFAEFMRSENELYSKIIREIGLVGQ